MSFVPADYPASQENSLLFQSFEWHTHSDPAPPHEKYSHNSHWSRLKRVLPTLAKLGVTSIWLPPGCKANNPHGNGYDCYDLWDLGEFDQKWTRSTKWGSREELSSLVQEADTRGVDVIWDAVLNHKTAGDATDEAWAVEVDKNDRRIEIAPPKKISAWLKYEFPGRERENMKHSPFKWQAEHFNGTDWDQQGQKNALFKLIDDPATYPKPEQQQPPQLPTKSTSGLNRLARLAGNISSSFAEVRSKPQPKRPGKGWAEDVDTTYGNYDYLIFSNIWYGHPEVRADVLSWGDWMINNTGVHGFRLDAAQHFSWNFAREWIGKVQSASRQKRGRDAFIIGEVWAHEVSRQIRWLDAVTPPGSGALAYAFDSPLLYSFSRVSEDVRRGSKNADLRTLLCGPAGFSDHQALVSLRPSQAVTFVTNHDTQPGQTSYTPMEHSLKASFYAFILLRRDGLPCVFWGDLYGTNGPHAEPPVKLLPALMLSRKLFAYGMQKDYFSHASCIGWTRSGTPDRPGCAVVLSIGPPNQIAVRSMVIGQPGQTWVDIVSGQEVAIDKKGYGAFTCQGMNVAVYIAREAFAAHERLFSAGFDCDAYRQ